jgi:hypothetical protein
MRGESLREMVEESLAEVARRRKAREPVEDVRGVNALLSKLRYVLVAWVSWNLLMMTSQD